MPENKVEFIDKVVDEFNRIKQNSVDINEAYQYALMNAFLVQIAAGVEPLRALLPPDIAIAGRTDNFFSINYLDSFGTSDSETTSESINYFLSRKFDEKLLKLNSKDIGSLLSYVRFTRVPKVKGRPNFKEAVEIKFDTHYNKRSLESILQGNSGVGLNSLKVDVISNTGAYYAYQVSMSINFANAQVIVNNPNYYLLLTTPTKDQEKNAIVYSVVFGWADQTPNVKSHENAEQLTDQHLCLLLTLKTYSFNFNMDGSVTLNIDFIGAAESGVEEISANILVNSYIYDVQAKGLESKIFLEQERLKELKKKNEEEIEQKTRRRSELSALLQQRDLNSQERDETARLTADLDSENPDGIAQKFSSVESTISEKIEQNKKAFRNLKYSSFMTYLFAVNRVYQGGVKFLLALGEEGKEPTTQLSFVPHSTLRNNHYSIFGEQSEIEGSTLPNARNILMQSIAKAAARPENLIAAEIQLNSLFSSAEESYAKSGKEIVEEAIKRGTAPDQAIEYGSIWSPYIFVGDVVGLAFENANSNMLQNTEKYEPFLDNYKVVLGTLDIAYKKSFFKSGEEINNENIKFAKRFTVDIAKIPISYNIFVSWFIKDVVSKGIEVYPFKQFVKDFMNNCVLKIIQNFTTWEYKFIQNNVQTYSRQKHAIIKTFADENIETTFVDLPYDLDKEFNTGAIASITRTGRIKLSDLKTKFLSDRIIPFVGKNDLTTPIYKYAFIYGKFGNVNRNGNYSDNLRAGIYHFYVGSTTGILKDIKFIPINMSQRQTALISNALNENKGIPFNEKFNVISRYDVDINCVGFQYFKPGQIIYVDTSLLGFGKSTDQQGIAAQFTLGGYYLIHKVSHDITQNDFSTNIVAKFVGKGVTSKPTAQPVTDVMVTFTNEDGTEEIIAQ